MKQDHQRWLEQQDRETQGWNEERAALNERIHQLGLAVDEVKNKSKAQDE